MGARLYSHNVCECVREALMKDSCVNAKQADRGPLYICKSQYPELVER